MFVSARTRATAHRRRRSLVALAGIAGLAVSSAIVVTSAPSVSAADPVDLQLLAFNDYHGHVQANTPGSIDGDAAGGGAFLAAKLTELRAGKTNTLTVAAGDLIGGSPFFSGLFHDEPSVESLNAMGLDVSGVGNHEFDEGVTELLRMQNGGCHPVDDCYFPSDPYAGADFPWLAANVVDGTDTPVLPPYWINEVGGIKVGFIGMTLEATNTLVAASGIVGYTFKDEVTTANALVPELQGLGVEAIIVLLHEGGVPNPFAINGCAGMSGPVLAINDGLSAEIDAIVSGHTHQPYTCSLDDPAGNPRPVTSAYSFGRVVTEINLKLDPVTGDVMRDEVTAVNHPVIQSELTPDAAVTAVIDKWTPLAADKGDEQIGQITTTITRGGTPPGSDRGVESAAGNLVADAQLFATKVLGAQIALMNPGGVRSDLTYPESDGEGDGVVTYGEAFTFQPFNNTLFILPMTGAQIASVLEEQCQPGGSSRPVLHLGVSQGFGYDLDITLQDGVCTDVEVSNLKLNGVPIAPATTYQVTTNNFLADGGDNFGTFADVDASLRRDGGQDLEALIAYLGAQSPIAPPPTTRANEIGTVLPSPISSVSPGRLLDTRTGPNDKTVDGEFEGIGRVAAGGVVELVVADRGGITSDAKAVLLNVGAVLPDADGFLTIYPCGSARPLASSVNYVAGDVVSNAVLAKVGLDGKVCIYTKGATDLIADVNGFVKADGSPDPVEPARLLETRSGPNDKTVDGLSQGKGRAAAGSITELVVRDRAGVPSDATAVMLNVGAVLADAAGFLTIYPCGTTRPLASSLNYAAGEVVSNSVLVKVGVGSTVCIYTKAATDLIADVNGFVPAGGSPAGLVPARLLETRSGPTDKTVDGQFEGAGRVAAGGVVELLVAGRGGVPADAESAVLNLGAVLPGAAGFLTVYPCGTTRPLASNVNYLGGDVVSNLVLAEIGTGGRVCIYTKAATDIIADVNAATSAVTAFRT